MGRQPLEKKPKYPFHEALAGSHEYASAVWVRGDTTEITEGQVDWPVKSGVRKVAKVLSFHCRMR